MTHGPFRQSYLPILKSPGAGLPRAEAKETGVEIEDIEIPLDRLGEGAYA